MKIKIETIKKLLGFILACLLYAFYVAVIIVGGVIVLVLGGVLIILSGGDRRFRHLD